MSKGSSLSLLSSCLLLVLLQVCIVAQLSPISSSSQLLTGGHQIGADGVSCQDHIRRARWMSSHARDEFDGHCADSISDEELTRDDEYASDDGGVSPAGGEAGEGLLAPDDDDEDEGGGSGGTKDSSGSGGGDVQCPECGKLFRNDKSMFGHLRSHPNRGYKGATPPVKKLKLSPETGVTSPSSSSSVLGTNGLSPPPQHSGRDPQLTPLEIVCAYVILSLKYRDNNKAPQQAPPPPPASSSVKLEAVGQAEGGTRGLVTDSGSTTAEFKCNAGGEASNLSIREGHSDFIGKIPKKRRNMPKDIREEHRKKAKAVLTPKEKRPYACKHCKAEFPTNQALGGHVAGHHREKKARGLNDPPAMAAESQNNGRRRVKGDDLSLQKGLHSKQLPMTLDVTWRSGMASGGQHSERRNIGLSSAVESPTPARTDDGDVRRLWDLNIDLNVDAPEQE